MAVAAKKILIVGPSWVGDMVMAQSLFIVLKERNPHCVIDVLAPAWSLPILERMPEVRQGISMPVGHGKLELGMRYRLGKKLAQEGYQQSILLPNSLKSALVPFFASIPERTGWRGEMRFGLLNDIRKLDKDKYPLMVQRFVALAYPAELKPPLPEDCPNPALQVDSSGLNVLLEKYQLQKTKPILALCPGAEFGPAKRWPERHYAEVARSLLDHGWQVALFGSDNDRVVTDTIKQLLPAQQQPFCHSLAGKTTLAEAVDILSQASAVVSNDSGLMHIAAALGRPVVVVYGSTSPDFTPPLSDNVRVERLGVECSPCFQRECPLSKDKMKCLNELSPQSVIEALTALLPNELARDA